MLTAGAIFIRPVSAASRAATWFAFSATLLACGKAVPSGDRTDSGETSRTASLQLLQPPASLPLTLQTANGAQRGVVPPAGDERFRTALRTDDEATARLCGVLVGRSRFSEVLPFGWPVDSLMPQLAPKILTGADVYGLRVLVPGKEASYRFEGFTRDGATRVSLRWPVRSERSVPATASDPEIEAVIQPSPASLDSLVMALRYADTTARPPGNVPATTVSAPDIARAVRLVRDVPYFPIGFSAPCRDAHFFLTVGAGIDKVIRVLVKKDERITATVASSTGKIAVSVVAGPGDAPLAASATATATADGYVVVRVRYTTTAPGDPIQQTILLRVMSEQR
ncbi:hypothetical protein [Gemmatimonas phototrophica]|uniref:Uncharacterized protein n=1 Tax=Gemmatimonas phototrophica TaxID=1379270 RepID=A0A143BIW6_9BACT|nr:hypothetical protein [Gemmatimonas phototrophica]AMW04521.1 hypothetical protein GEMMAAP_06005 [Gemmatimonas phototrophica]